MKRSPLTTTAVGAALLVLDVIGIAVMSNIAYSQALSRRIELLSPAFLGLVAIILVTLYVLDVYRTDEANARVSIPIRAGFGVALAGLMVAGFLFITKSWERDPLFLRGILTVAMVPLAAWVMFWRFVIVTAVWRVAGKARWLVLGEGAPLHQFVMDYDKFRAVGEYAVLVPSAEEKAMIRNVGARSITGTYEELPRLRDAGWTGVVIATAAGLPGELLRKIMDMRLAGTRVYDLTDFYERYLQKVPVVHLKDGWFTLSHGFNLLHHHIELRLKRALDLVLAGALLVLTSPLALTVALMVALDRRGGNRGPLLYSQERTGTNGKVFLIYKFRTMKLDAERSGPRWAQENDPRVTRVGRFLRRAHLDELPQLWNVLKGEMSFVGPRPERPDFNRDLERAIPYYELRHIVKPGITGWAQVMYPYGSSVEDALEKLQYDIYYIKNYSLLLDAMIILKTLRAILFRKGR